MTRPKKWFLEENLAGIIIKNAEGPLKKPNASHPLGNISSVSEAPGKSDSVLVSILKMCMEGEIVVFVCASTSSFS